MENKNTIVLRSLNLATNNDDHVAVSTELVDKLMNEMHQEGTDLDAAMVVSVLLKLLNYNEEGKLSLL